MLPKLTASLHALLHLGYLNHHHSPLPLLSTSERTPAHPPSLSLHLSHPVSHNDGLVLLPVAIHFLLGLLHIDVIAQVVDYTVTPTLMQYDTGDREGRDAG